MIKLAVVKFFRQQPYKKLVISEEEAWYPGFKEKDGKILILITNVRWIKHI
ncbi:MAG: hypothetical protein ACNA7I_09380 [Candidatus Methanoperedens sp.]|nr:hypothetical protein [Candidatus Methanoperedens sp.]